MCEKMSVICDPSGHKSHLDLDEVKRDLTFRKLYLDLSFEYLPVLLDDLSDKVLELSAFTIIHFYKLQTNKMQCITLKLFLNILNVLI